VRQAQDLELVGRWLSIEEALIFSELSKDRLLYLLRRYGLGMQRISAAALADALEDGERRRFDRVWR
jgi:hypothetical protein